MKLDQLIEWFIMISGGVLIYTSMYIMTYTSISRYSIGNVIVELSIFVSGVLILILPSILKEDERT